MRSLAELDAIPFGIEYSALDTEHQRWRPWRSYVAVCHASTAIASHTGGRRQEALDDVLIQRIV